MPQTEVPPMRVTVRLFARLRDIVGEGELERHVPAGATAQHLWDALAADHPALAPYGTVSSCAVNEEYAKFNAQLHDGDEIAFLPPVSGGVGVRELWIGGLENGD
ncbi:MAG: molybdopterin converting factor subunit 1 [Vicinamibacterales bacterium]